jgi:Fungal specific transcription factor domain
VPLVTDADDYFKLVFHCIMAMAAGLDSVMGMHKNPMELLKHLGNTYRCINRNLQQKDGKLSDSTIAAVMSMAIHEELLGEPKRTRIHVDALARMVDMRGGIQEFEWNRMLLQKICRYVHTSSRWALL